MGLLKKYIYNILGWISFGLGVIGAFLPILPTTPFILLAAHFFSKGSPKFYNWLVALKYFGPKIKSWKENGVIDKKSKIIGTVSLAIIFSVILVFLDYLAWVKAVIGVIFLCVIYYINTRPSQANSQATYEVNPSRESVKINR